MARLIYGTIDKRTKKGFRENVIEITTSEESHVAYDKLTDLINKKKLACVKIEGNGELFFYSDEKDFEKLIIDMKKIITYLKEQEENKAYYDAIIEVYNEYPEYEEDIEKVLKESDCENIFELAYIFDNYMRRTLQDSIFRYMENKYVPDETYICEIYGNSTGEYKFLQVIDLKRKMYIYSIKYNMLDDEEYRKYKEHYLCIALCGIEEFVATYPNILDFDRGDCVIREYFF